MYAIGRNIPYPRERGPTTDYIIQIVKIAWVAYMYLGALSHLNATLIPQIAAYPPVLAQCKVHRPWALFREGTVHVRPHYDTWLELHGVAFMLMLVDPCDSCSFSR